MKKLLCLCLSLMLLCSMAFADEDNWVEASPILYEGAIESLLFNTHNVALTGEASFSIDGEWFKTANAVYRQDGVNSYLDYRLTAPGPEGSVRENGYTVVANGEYFYVMESYPNPGTYKSGAGIPQDTVMRKTVQTQTMFAVFRNLANQAYALLGNDAISTAADENKTETLHIQAGEDVPDYVNLALSLFWQYAARRFFETDTELIDATDSIELVNYPTVTKGLLATTRFLSLKKADVTVVMDARGYLQQISGSASVMLSNLRLPGSDKQLDIIFKLETSDFGTTKVALFNPADYDVVLYTEPAAVDYDEETMNRLEGWSDHAYFSWNQAGYENEMAKYCLGNHRWIGDMYYMKYSSDGSPDSLLTIVNSEGELLEMEHFDGFTAPAVDTPYPDEELVKATLEKTRNFLLNRYPDVAARMGDMKLIRWREKDGRTDFFFVQDPAPEANGITFTVRALPEWRIETIVCDSNV